MRYASAGRPLQLRSRQTSPPPRRSRASPGAPQHRDNDVPQNGHDLLAGAGGSRAASARLGMVHNLLSGIKQRAWDFFPIVGTRPKSRAEHGTGSLASDVEMHPIWVDLGANETYAPNHMLMRHFGGAGG